MWELVSLQDTTLDGKVLQMRWSLPLVESKVFCIALAFVMKFFDTLVVCKGLFTSAQ